MPGTVFAIRKPMGTSVFCCLRTFVTDAVVRYAEERKRYRDLAGWA